MSRPPVHCWYCPPGSTPEEGTELAIVAYQEQNSGPGWSYYACGPCRKENGLAPMTSARYTVGTAPGTTLTCIATVVVLAWLAVTR